MFKVFAQNVQSEQTKCSNSAAKVVILFDICNKNQRKLCFFKLSAEFVSEKLLITYGSSLIVYTWSSPLPPRYHSYTLLILCL